MRNIIIKEVVNLTVYADALFLVNFLVNTVIMFLSIRLAGLKINFYRICFSGIVGAFYAVCVFILGNSLLNSFFTKLAVSEIMVLLANGSISLKNNIFCLIMMYVISFVCSGAVMAIAFLKGTNAFFGIKYAYLISALIISLIAVQFFLNIKSRREGRVFEKITIELNGKKVKLCALVDTGNMLSEPISGVPVAIVEAQELKGIISQYDMQNIHNLKLRYIPYRALGNDFDMLTGFVPDKFLVAGHDVKCCVAIYKGKLSSRSEYTALISPQLCNYERERINE